MGASMNQIRRQEKSGGVSSILFLYTDSLPREHCTRGTMEEAGSMFVIQSNQKASSKVISHQDLCSQMALNIPKG